MIIKNKHNLPEPIINAVKRDEQPPRPGVVRVTSLLKGVREVILEQRYWDKVERDASDMAWLLFGRAVHSIIEQEEELDHQLKETRLTERVGGLDLSGQFDLYDAKRKMIIDYKTCSVWKFIYNDFKDWRKQTLIYAWLLRKAGFKVDKAQIVAFIKDHSKSKAQFDAQHPDAPVKTVDFTFTDKDFTDIEAFIHERMAEIEASLDLPDAELPLCTQEERWNKGDQYAVMKGKNKRATRVYENKEEAEARIEKEGAPYWLEVRPGIDRKCGDYCAVNAFCPYWQEKQKEDQE